VETPPIPKGYYSSFAQYTVKLKNREQRDGLQTELKKHNIPSMIYYNKPMHKQGAFSDLNFNEEDFSVTDELCNIVLSLPMHPYLKEEDVDIICNKIKNYINN